MAESGSSMFGQHNPFGIPSHDLQTNIQYATQAAQFAAGNPQNAQAQRQAAYWAEVVARQQATLQQMQQAPQVPFAPQPDLAGQAMPHFGAAQQMPTQTPQTQPGVHYISSADAISNHYKVLQASLNYDH